MAEAFSSAVGFTSDSLMVRIGGQATREHSPGFVRSVSTLMEQSDGRALVVDLEPCDYLDSTFLGCLVVLFRRADQRMTICATDATRQQLFASARVDRLIPVREPTECAWPCEWRDFQDAEPCDPRDLIENVAVAHRCLADVEGPNAEVYRDVADQLEGELRSEPL